MERLTGGYEPCIPGPNGCIFDECAHNKMLNRLAAYEDTGLSPEEVAELAKAKKDGRLVVLPCKVGTRVWVIGQNCDLCRDMYAEEPCLFGSCEYKEVFESVFGYGMIDNFGKTVFLTRADAEGALVKDGTPSDWTKNKACRDAVLKTFGGES